MGEQKSMNPVELKSIEEELQKDLEAIARVRRILESKNGNIRAVGIDDLDETPVTSLRAKIEEIINSDPSVKWTTQKMLTHLQRIGFTLKAQKPIYSIGQSLNKLCYQGRILLVRKGVGSTPNLYRAKDLVKSGTEIPESAQYVQGDKNEEEAGRRESKRTDDYR